MGYARGAKPGVLYWEQGELLPGMTADFPYIATRAELDHYVGGVIPWSGFCLLEKRFVDVALRYGIHPATLDRWRRTLDLKTYFEGKIGGSVYGLLPGVMENSLR